LDLGVTFFQKIVFRNFGGQKPKISKNRDSHLVEVVILRIWTVFGAFCSQTAAVANQQSLDEK
jgi:hypothetical protein